MSLEICLRSADFAHGENATEAVLSALERLRGSVDARLSFEKGEYHFYEQGSAKRHLAVSNNSCGEKSVVFMMEEHKNLTVDGGDSVFVFHERTFPFVADRCQGLTLCNFHTERALPPVAELVFKTVTSEGFLLEIDRQKTPYSVENGDLIFHREGWDLHSSDQKLSLHKIEPFFVQYLFTRHCGDSRDNLPASFVEVTAEETDGGIWCRYRPESPTACRFFEGERALMIAEDGRNSDVIHLVDSEDVTVRRVSLCRSWGMGIIAQTCRNVEVDSFCTDSARYGDAVSLTADALHFVNCDGKIHIHHCNVEHIMDDAINIHGVYTEVESASAESLDVRLMHYEQKGVNVYRAGDVLDLIDPQSMCVTARFCVRNAAFSDQSLFRLHLDGDFLDGSETVKTGFFVENPHRMPDVHVCQNRFYHLPHLRISGAGEIVVEQNEMEDCAAALLAYDLAQYWYESGRIRHLIFRQNHMKFCNKMGGHGFVKVGVSGFDDDRAPKIHQWVEIYDNDFVGFDGMAIRAAGVERLSIRDNRFSGTPAPYLRIDGTLCDVE